MEHGNLLSMDEELIRFELFGCDVNKRVAAWAHARAHTRTRMPGRLVTCLSGVLARVPNAQYVLPTVKHLVKQQSLVVAA